MILTVSGRTALAQALAAQTLYFAWGSGNPAWDATPEPETVALAALEAEIGRRVVDEVGYCVPDPAGEIIAPSGRFRKVSTPTNNLLIRTGFWFGDAAGATIREVAVFLGTQTRPDLPPGQRYFVPGEIVAPGTLLSIERLAAMPMSGATRPSFEYVQTI